MSLSKREIMAEIVRCGKDPAYFCTSYAKVLRVGKCTNLIELSLTLNSKSTVGSSIAFDVFGAPTMDHTVLARSSEEHALIICDGNAVDGILVFIKGGDKTTLWSELFCSTSLIA